MKSKIALQSTNSWDENVLFPVVCRPLNDLLPEYQIRASDRQNLIIGNGNIIYGIQGLDYTLIPNQLIFDCVNDVIGDHEVKILHNTRGEFSINVHLPSKTFNVGTRTDTLQKSLIINNSYNGRSHFKIQGSVVGSATDQVRQQGMRVSYYRQICTNGLHAWSDEFMSMDDYLDWLLKGQPVDKEVKKFKVSVDHGIGEVEREKEELLRKSFKHKSLELESFSSQLSYLLDKFMTDQDSVTLKVYERMEAVRIKRNEADKLLVDAGLPKQLTKLALDRLDLEVYDLNSDYNAWLLMNAANYALFSDKNALSIEKRYEADKRVYHNLNQMLLVGESVRNRKFDGCERILVLCTKDFITAWFSSSFS